MRPRKSSLKLQNCAKLEPRYCGYLDVLKRIGLVKYRIVLPANTRYQNVFHVYWLKKYVHDTNHVNYWNVI